VALGRPDSGKVQPFRHMLRTVRSPLDITMIVQYRSQTSETIDYIEEYVTRFQETKDIFLEYLVSKRMQAKADE